MRRADRLFRMMEYLKARKSIVRAQDLADLMEVSIRTIYRDMADLISSGAPITGEAGTGYILDQQHIIRPLMFDLEELDALALGARMVESWGDKALAASALSALDKIRATLPADKNNAFTDDILFSFPSQNKPELHIKFTDLRLAIRKQSFIEFTYMKELNNTSNRTVRPLALAFFAPVWLLLGWCEDKQDFRNFRLDKMHDLHITDRHFKNERGKTTKDFIKLEKKKNKHLNASA